MEELEQQAMDLLKDKWGHLYINGYPQKPFPTGYQLDLNAAIVGLIPRYVEIQRIKAKIEVLKPLFYHNPESLSISELLELEQQIQALKQSPQPPAQKTLKDLVGRHFLSGVGIDDYQQQPAVQFILDNIVYCAIEDVSDCHRSYFGSLFIIEQKPKNVFHPHEVFGVLTTENIIQFIDVVTNKVVFVLGTDYTDAHYPFCIKNWYPENLALNKDNILFKDYKTVLD